MLALSKETVWARLSSTARDISAGLMRLQEEVGGMAEASEGTMNLAAQAVRELPMSMGGTEEGPEIAINKRDLSDGGPGGARFVYLEDINLEPTEGPSAALMRRIPAPGEPGFVAEEQKNIFPADSTGSVKESQRDPKNTKKLAPKREPKDPD